MVSKSDKKSNQKDKFIQEQLYIEIPPPMPIKKADEENDEEKERVVVIDIF